MLERQAAAGARVRGRLHVCVCVCVCARLWLAAASMCATYYTSLH